MTEPAWIRWLRRISHPLALLPIAIVTAAWFGSYSPQQITELQEVPLFLQGSTDMGGSDLFAGTLALYVVCGVLGAIYLTIALDDRPNLTSWSAEALRALWILKYHVVLFVVAGTAPWDYDRRIGPNDFRNMFLWAAVLYACSIGLIVTLGRTRLALSRKILLAPVMLYVWLILGWDGNTAKAGQVLLAGQDPAPGARGIRHGLMLRWHGLC